MSDANWGPQDATVPTVPIELPPFASRSMSAFYIDLLGPVHWLSKRQTITAGSSAEAEIYATDECSWRSKISSFLLRQLSTMIIKRASNGQKALQPKDYVTSR